MKISLIPFIFLILPMCAEEIGRDYYFCDISNQSNDTIVVDLVRIYFDSYKYEVDSAFEWRTEVPPCGTEECRSNDSKKLMFQINKSFKFVFLKKKNDGKPYMKKDILAVKYATADSLEKWGMLVTYP